MRCRNWLMASVVLATIVTATGAAAVQCIGDCDGGGGVTVNETIGTVNIALGNAPVAMSEAGDTNGDGRIELDQINTGVNHALPGSPVVASSELEKAAGVASSTLVALLALLDDIPVRAIPVILTEYGETAGSCSEGGTVNLSCQESGGNSTITASLSNCGVLVGGEVVTSDGNFVVVVTNPGVCSSGVIPNNVPFTTHFIGFSATYSDGTGTSTPDFTETVDASGLGCAEELDGTFTLDGSFVVTAPDGVDLSGTTSQLRMQITSSGAPCVLQVTGNGSLDLKDNGNDRQFSASFANTRATVQAGPYSSLQESLDGHLNASCVGEMTVTTNTPLTVPGGGCSTGGQLSVAFADGTHGNIHFTSEGGVEFDYNGDGTFDNAVSNCHDSSISQCGVTQKPTATRTVTRTPTRASTATPRPSATPTPSPSSPPAPGCVGDCDGTGAVAVNNIITLVNIALGNTPVTACEAGDANHDNQITVDEILTTVNNALYGCGGHAPTPTPRPSCVQRFDRDTPESAECVFAGSFNTVCGGGNNLGLFVGGSGGLMAAGLNDPFVEFGAQVTSPTSADIYEWGTQPDWSDAQPASGTITLDATGTVLTIAPTTVLFTIGGCEFQQYAGTYIGTYGTLGGTAAAASDTQSRLRAILERLTTLRSRPQRSREFPGRRHTG